MLPALAILTAVAVAHLLAWMGTRSVRCRSTAAAALVTSAIVLALAFPGLRDLAAWAARATDDLPAIQAEVADVMTDRRPIEGQFAPTVAMRVAVPIIVPSFGVNQGDSYDEHDARWWIDTPDSRPRWTPDHADAWAMRERIECFPWPPAEELCLVRVP
jgi:hypothetical protein